MSRLPYQPLDGPLAQEPIVLEDDQFDSWDDTIDITITGTGWVAVYRRIRRNDYGSSRIVTIDGNPWGRDEDAGVCYAYSYEMGKVRALFFMGWKG